MSNSQDDEAVAKALARVRAAWSDPRGPFADLKAEHDEALAAKAAMDEATASYNEATVAYDKARTTFDETMAAIKKRMGTK